MTDAQGRNDKFLEDMAHLALKANCKLVVCPRVDNNNDRWIQVGARLVQRRTGWVAGAWEYGSSHPAAKPGDTGLRGPW